MRCRRTLIALIALCMSTIAHAVSLDSLLNLPALAVPVVNYSPETDWAFGAAVQGYFQVPNRSRTSFVQLDGAYSLQKQWYVNTQGTIYFAGRVPCQLSYRGGYRDYPDTYYELGNGGRRHRPQRKTGQTYQSVRGYAHLEPLWQVAGSHWSLGLVGDFITERVPNLAVPYPSMLMWGVGGVLQYDSRDILFYPHSGLFLKASVTHYEPTLGSTVRMTDLNFDFRSYIPIYRELIFALQLRWQCALAAKGTDLPFQMLPTLGGYDLLRGIPRGMYRDNTLVVLQGELRIPIYKWIRATVFAGLGDVCDVWQLRFHNRRLVATGSTKVGYGVGLRASINKAKVNLRFDVARNNIDLSWKTWQSYSFYLTATEAF